VTLLFDTRQRAYVASEPGKPHAVDSAVHAASDVFGALFDQGNLVGIAAFDTVPCWFDAGAGSEHRERARMLFAQHPALSPRAAEPSGHRGRLHRPDDTRPPAAVQQLPDIPVHAAGRRLRDGGRQPA